MRSKRQEGKDWWTMNLKSKTGSEKQLRGLGFLVRQSRFRSVEELVPEWRRGWSLGGDKWSSHALQAPGEYWWQMWRLGPENSLRLWLLFPFPLAHRPFLHVRACLLTIYWRGESLSSITLPFFYTKQTQWTHHWHLRETTVYTHVQVLQENHLVKCSILISILITYFGFLQCF